MVVEIINSTTASRTAFDKVGSVSFGGNNKLLVRIGSLKGASFKSIQLGQDDEVNIHDLNYDQIYDIKVDKNEADLASATKQITLNLEPQDEHNGLKRKYIVFKSDTGESVEDCFVLRPDIDDAARAALRAYADATNNEQLSADIRNWLKYALDANEPPKNKVEILMESGRRFDVTTTAKTAKEFNDIIADIIDSGIPLRTIDDEYIINVMDICEIRFIEMSQVSDSKSEYTKPKVNCVVGKDTKTEECEWCAHNSKCEIYKGDC